MPASWAFDWTTFWVLLGMTLWEGARRLPAGTCLLRQAAGYPWHVAAGPYTTPAWRMASWLSPLVCHVVLTPGAGTGRVPPRHLGRWVVLVRVPSAVVLAALVVGVPLMTATAGFRGLVQAAVLAFGGALVTALAAGVALLRMGVPARTAARDGLGILSPFTAPRAPEIVLSRALEGVAFSDAVRALLPADAFAEWARPLAYDLTRGDAGEGAEALLPPREATAILASPPPGVRAGEAYCDRCGRVYLPTAAACRACGGVAMVTVGG